MLRGGYLRFLVTTKKEGFVFTCRPRDLTLVSVPWPPPTPSTLDSLLSCGRVGQKRTWLGPLLLGMVGAMHGEQASTKLSSAPAPAWWLPDVPPRLDFILLTLTALPFLLAPPCIHWDHALLFPISLAPSTAVIAKEANGPGSLGPSPLCGAVVRGCWGWRLREFECSTRTGRELLSSGIPSLSHPQLPLFPPSTSSLTRPPPPSRSFLLPLACPCPVWIDPDLLLSPSFPSHSSILPPHSHFTPPLITCLFGWVGDLAGGHGSLCPARVLGWGSVGGSAPQSL